MRRVKIQFRPALPRSPLNVVANISPEKKTFNPWLPINNRNYLGQFHEIPLNQTTDVHRRSTLIQYNAVRSDMLTLYSGDPDQTPRSVASDIVLHCLPMSQERTLDLLWLIIYLLIPQPIVACLA